MGDSEYSPRKKIPRLNQIKEDGDGSKKVENSKSIKKESASEKSFAEKYMNKHGYKEGKGLGKHQDGIVEPVEASKQKGRRGFGFESIDLIDAVSKYDPSLEELSFNEEVNWLLNDYADTVNTECLESWIKIGPAKKCIDENSNFCDLSVVRDILASKNALDAIGSKELDNGRKRANAFELIANAIFLNRAAMKMANLDAILDRMFTRPKSIDEKEVVEPNELLYFADVCAGPGGFSEYILYRKKWRAKGFGFTLQETNDFTLDQFWAGPPETFEPHYGARGDGNVYISENIISFKKHVLKHTDNKGVHFMMADGGVRIEEKFSDQELICKKLYFCQCLVALHVVRTGGHFVVKLFDLFTDFSIGLLYLMYRSFSQISIIKPNTSRPANSERYLVCKWKRENCSEIADFLLQLNESLPLYEEESEKDILELVPVDFLKSDTKFYEYIRDSNNRLGRKQAFQLKKLAAYCENTTLRDERQQELRKACLKLWDIPEEARVDPKKCDARSECTELLSNFPTHDRKNKIQSFESFKENILSIYSWCGVVVSGEESESTCALYMGLGRNNVLKYESGKWVKPKCENLSFPAKTLVYGEICYEHFGSGKSQIKTYAFHIIDGMRLGGEDISFLPFQKRLKMCKLFAKALCKETFPVRVKDHYPLPQLECLWEKLTLSSMKSRTQCLGMPLESERFYKAGGIVFIRDTKDPWTRQFSRTREEMYLYNSQTQQSLFESQLKAESRKKVYGDFGYCFQNRLIWWWGEGVVVHDSHSFNPNSSKMQKTDIMKFIVSNLKKSEINLQETPPLKKRAHGIQLESEVTLANEPQPLLLG